MIHENAFKDIFVNLEKYAPSVIDVLSIFIAEDKKVLSRQYLLENTPFSSRSKIIQAIEVLKENAVLEYIDSVYALKVSQNDLLVLKSLLQGSEWSKRERAGPEIKLVMTAPKAPSSLQKTIASLGHNKSLIIGTEETYEDIAKKCKQKFSVMAPFLDDVGAKHLLKLYEICPPEADKQLILRFLSAPDTSSRFPQGLKSIENNLLDLGVNIFDYSIERESSSLLETFHAKVIVCDNSYAYLGSSNFHKYSIDNSMELGVLLEGSPVPLLRKLFDVIVSISVPYKVCSVHS